MRRRYRRYTRSHRSLTPSGLSAQSLLGRGGVQVRDAVLKINIVHQSRVGRSMQSSRLWAMLTTIDEWSGTAGVRAHYSTLPSTPVHDETTRLCTCKLGAVVDGREESTARFGTRYLLGRDVLHCEEGHPMHSAVVGLDKNNLRRERPAGGDWDKLIRMFGVVLYKH